MNSEIKVYSREEGQIQRVQVLRWDDWLQLDFLYPQKDASAIGCFAHIYRNFLVPACPWIFPQMIMFSLPTSVNIADYVDLQSADTEAQTLSYKSQKYGEVSDALMIASIILQEGIKLKKGRPVFANDKAERLYHKLEEENCVHIICGKLPYTKAIPVGLHTGYLSAIEPDAAMKVNASFFIMDPIDCATIYDQIGTILGLCVKSGFVQSPPLFNRESLLVRKDGRVSIEELDIKALSVEICGTIYRHGQNAMYYSRPERTVTPAGKGLRVVIVGNRVVAIKRGGKTEIPASGFVLCIDEQSTVSRTIPIEETIHPGTEVIYHGLEDVEFGIQVGNSIVRDGIPTDHFISKFYDIHKLDPIPYPPSLYPMDFENARAARMALGADAEGRPMLFWAEGAGKFGGIPGVDSTGASLSEMAEIAVDLGMQNAINLDGGGSAQILLQNQRSLRISDRKKEDNSDAERLIPIGLWVR